MCESYLVDSRKSRAELFVTSLNWFISLSRSETEVLPSSPEKEFKIIISFTYTMYFCYYTKEELIYVTFVIRISVFSLFLQNLRTFF